VSDAESTDPVLTSVHAYTEHADEYATVHAPKMHDRVEWFARSLPAHALILDAGCGPGRDLARFAALGHVPIGVELNATFAAMACSLAPTWRADLRRLDVLFPSGIFDGVWASASLVHLPESEAAEVLRHFATVLRPGGQLYACVNTVGETGWLDEPDGRRWYCIWEPDAFVDTVAAAGFRVLRVERGPFVEVWAAKPG